MTRTRKFTNKQRALAALRASVKNKTFGGKYKDGKYYCIIIYI